jgi:hypothetical protein
MRVVAFLRSTLSVPILIAALLAAGCGGSGSSGFDALPASEPEAITRVIGRDQCLGFEGTTYCGSQAQAPIDTAEVASIRIDDPGDPLVCAGLRESPACATSLPFVPDGFPEGTVFLAAHGDVESGPWTLTETEPTPIFQDPNVPVRQNVTIVMPAGSHPPEPLLVAVLVYLGRVPEVLPPIAPSLADFSADVVYVGPRLEIKSTEPPG